MIRQFFKIRREERGMMLVVLFVFLFFQYLMIARFFSLFAFYTPHNWQVFMDNFHMSGFDPISYSVITDWHQGFDLVRHPLLAYLLYPLYLLNQLLWTLTGVNCVQLITGVILLFCSCYSCLFLFRICREVTGASAKDSALLGAFFFSFAYVLVAAIVPDHFMLSLFLILLTLYLAGTKIRHHGKFSLGEALFLFVITAGVTLSNGITVFLAVLFTNGIKTFHPRYFLMAFVFPSVILLGSAEAFLWSHGNKMTPVESQMRDVHREVPKSAVAVENFFGESVQLHRGHLLGDVLVNRPVIVKYSWTLQYVAEGAYLLLFLMGMYYGRRERFFWLNMSILLFTVFLHFGLGFGLNEVHIMACHWIYVIPVTVAYLLVKGKGAVAGGARLLLLVLTLYLWSYHTLLLWHYLTWPVRY